MAREVRQPGVELHGKSYRYRLRLMEDGTKRVGAYKRWPFIEGPAAKALPKSDPLRRENALANANAFALRDRQQRKSPQRAGGIRDPEGSLLEWLIRYQMEGLDLRRYEPEDLEPMLAFINAQIDRKRGEPQPEFQGHPRKLKFHIAPRSEGGIYHDKCQIRQMIRLAREHIELDDMLRSPVVTLGPDHIQLLLSVWNHGKAKPKTKRRLLNTLASVWSHHEQFYNMSLERPWRTVKVLGDASAPKARALKKTELALIEAELHRLHPTVRGAIEFLRATGARKAEAAKLRWERLLWPDHGEPTAHFDRTKAARGIHKARFVYLDGECLTALARMLKPVDAKGRPIDYDPATFNWRKFDWPQEGWVFPAPKKPRQRISVQTIYQGFVRCVHHAGVKHASPHHLRHTKATVLTATVPQAMAQEMLGHEDAASFAIYRHLAEEAGYMVRDKQGQLVSAEELASKENIVEAIKKLPKKERAAVLMELMGD